MVTKVRTELVLVDKTKAAFSSFKRSLGGVKGLLSGIAGALGAARFGRFVSDSLQAADSINKLSDRLGVSTEALSEYKQVAALTGVTFGELTIGFQRLGRRVSQAAKGEGEAVKALAELGLEAEKLSQLDIDHQFEIIADAMANVTNETDKVRLAQKLFDSEGVKLIQTMKGGSSAIREMREEFRAAGGTLSGEAAEGASRALDAWTKLGAGTKALGVTLVTELAGPIEDTINWLSDNIPGAVQFSIDAFGELGRELSGFGAELAGVASSFSGFAAKAAKAVGLDQISGSLKFGAKLLQEEADALNAAAIKIERARTELDTGSAEGQSDRLTFQELYNAALSKTGELTKEQAAQVSAASKEAARVEKQRIDSINDYIERLQTEADTLGLSNAELVAYDLTKLKAADSTLLMADALQEEIDAFEAIAAIEKENADIFAKSTELQKKEAEAVAQRWEDTGVSMGQALSGAVREGGSFKDMIKSIEADLIRIAGNKLMEAAFGGAGGTEGGGFIGGLFKGLASFASGGRVSPGQTVVVGERGPELFTAGGAGGAVAPTINVNISGQAAAGAGGTSMQLAAQIGDQVARALRRNR